MSTKTEKVKEMMKSVSACLIEALVVVTLCTIGLCKNKKKLSDQQILQMTILLTCGLSLVDQFAPALSASLRQGLGFAVGAMMVGFP